jgi:pimeloyl-ACP methyl ester carboxylesterase
MAEAGPDLTMTRLAGSADSARVLVVGPSLGTSVEVLWGQAATLVDEYEVVGWDLPGHGRSRPATSAFTIDELAAVVRARSAELAGGRPVAYAGVSLGGAVALQFAVEPGVFSAVACIAGSVSRLLTAASNGPSRWTTEFA